jgi:hypothetical protein
MGGFSRPAPPPPPPAPVYTPAPTKAEVSQVSSTDTSGMLKGKGRTSTILTGAKGLGDNALTTSKKSLLGG